MSDDQHPFDKAAESLQKMADQPVAGQDASPDLWAMEFAADDSVGDYPQAMPLVEPKAWEPGDPIDETGGLDGDGFPRLPDGLEAQQLLPTAQWTDVLSSNLWSDGYLLSEKALQPFRQAALGQFREYPVTVVDSKGDERPYTYLFIKNEVPPSALDFERSEFYITDMLSTPIAPVTINSYEEWLTTLERANAGELEGGEEFSSIAYKRLYFRAGHTPEVELFRLERLCVTTYISTRFKDALRLAGITGLEIKHNRRLFVS